MDDTGPPLLGASLGASSDASLASGVLLGVASAVIAAPPDLLPPMQGAHTHERPLSAPVQAAAMTDEEVQKLAEAEGLALVPAVGTSTGYKGVTHSGGSTRPFKAQTRVEGTKKNLGCFATAAEAALAYARHLGPQASTSAAAAASPSAPLPAAASDVEAEAIRQAAAEGLVLQPAVGTATGYKGVTRSGGSSKPYKAQTRVQGADGSSNKKNLGCFTTAAEAALAYARHQKHAAMAQRATPAPAAPAAAAPLMANAQPVAANEALLAMASNAPMAQAAIVGQVTLVEPAAMAACAMRAPVPVPVPVSVVAEPASAAARQAVPCALATDPAALACSAPNPALASVLADSAALVGPPAIPAPVAAVAEPAAMVGQFPEPAATAGPFVEPAAMVGQFAAPAAATVGPFAGLAATAGPAAMAELAMVAEPAAVLDAVDAVVVDMPPAISEPIPSEIAPLLPLADPPAVTEHWAPLADPPAVEDVVEAQVVAVVQPDEPVEPDSALRELETDVRVIAWDSSDEPPPKRAREE